MSDGTKEVIVVTFFGVAGLWYALYTAKTWHLKWGKDANHAPSSWTLGAPAWRAWVRSEVPLPGACLGFVLIGLSSALELPEAVMLVSGGIVLISFLAMLSTAFLSWPRFLILPHLRSQPGLLRELASKPPIEVVATPDLVFHRGHVERRRAPEARSD